MQSSEPSMLLPLEGGVAAPSNFPIIGGLNRPPRLRPLRRLRGIFLMGAATPPFQGGEFAFPFSSQYPLSPAPKCGTCSPFSRRGVFQGYVIPATKDPFLQVVTCRDFPAEEMFQHETYLLTINP